MIIIFTFIKRVITIARIMKISLSIRKHYDLIVYFVYY
jgi:hypothetical protein